MKPFLQLVAEDIHKRFGDDLSRTAIIFPNKRAGLFFDEYLAEKIEHPIWSPPYLTISELFCSLSTLQVSDTIRTVCEIYRLYKERAQNPESLDFFYGWGERILNDFDDIDKNYADADRLFRNLEAIKAFDESNFLTEEQEEVLKEFFRDFSIEKNSELKQKFLELWNLLLPLYHRLNERLKEENLAYEGALYRNVLSELMQGKLTDKINRYDRYVFIGFNVLNKVEELFFENLKKQEKALFYWDYDTFYCNNETHFEAGEFIRRNLKRFPNALPENLYNNFSHPKQIEFIASPTENAQARYVTSWLKENLTTTENHTAVVLCNEPLLQPVLHVLPDNVCNVNVTKGFPLTQTPAFSLTEKAFDRWLSDEESARKKELELLNELALEIRNEARKEAEHKASTNEDRILQQLYAESFFQTYTIINRFRNLIEKGLLEINRLTLRRLMRQVLKQTSIPFHGEPAIGLQVMGLLETRNLDFERIILLSVNEGILPKKVSNASFIPYNLRKVFGLTTSEHKIAVYAYYFYRLIQRAQHVTCLYNSSTEGLVRGEMSRFMTQILVESDLPVKRYTLESGQAIREKALDEITKTEEMLSQCRKLSPSALNNYIRCQLLFYYKQILKLKEPESEPGVIEANTFGTLFHKSAELLYDEITMNGRKPVTKEALESISENDGILLMRYVRKAFTEENVEPQLLIAEVLRIYLKQLVEHDKHLAPFEIVEMEKYHHTEITIKTETGIYPVQIGGFIDRIDLINIPDSKGKPITTLRVVDYKTGGLPESARNMEQLITPSEKHPHYVFQTFIYGLTLCTEVKYPVAPALFFVHKAAGENYSPYITFGGKGEDYEAAEVFHFQLLADDFRKVLIQLLEEIFDISRPFIPTPNEKSCTTCAYKLICGR